MSSSPRATLRVGRSWRGKALTGLGLAGVTVLALAGAAYAQDAPTAESVQEGLGALASQTNLLWVVVGAVLVIFMQAGFALVETGFCRAKHSAHVVSTNFAIFGLGFVGYFLVGYAFMFGGYSLPVAGYKAALGGSMIGSGKWVFLYHGGFGLTGIGKAGTAGVAGFFLYMVAFMDTVAT